jgi:methylated-DNA-[protein]-cysteine S-methyltransferase
MDFVAPAFTIFATTLGDCAIAWNAVGLTGVWLPESSAARLRTRIVRRRPDLAEVRPEGAIDQAIGAITALLRGERTVLTAIPIDDTALDAFDARVYSAARTIPPGRVITYATLAERVGATATAREVGQSLGRNPFPIVVPCHRIVAAGGQLGGFSAPGGSATKRRLLTIEGARLDGAVDLFDSADACAPPAADQTALGNASVGTKTPSSLTGAAIDPSRRP